jgi:hypothetical protein
MGDQMRSPSALSFQGVPSEAANALVKALRQVFKWAVEADHADSNPVKEVPYIKTGSQGFHSWTIEEVRQYETRHPIGTRARLALVLLLHTSQRRSDVVRLGHKMAHNGWLKFTQAKNAERKPISLEIPILAELQRIIDATTPLGKDTYFVTEFGKAFNGEWIWQPLPQVVRRGRVAALLAAWSAQGRFGAARGTRRE